MYVHVHLQKLHRGKLLIANATVHLVVGFVRVLVHGLIVTRDHFVANVTEVHVPRYLFVAAMTYRRLNGTRSKKKVLLLPTIINKVFCKRSPWMIRQRIFFLYFQTLPISTVLQMSNVWLSRLYIVIISGYVCTMKINK